MKPVVIVATVLSLLLLTVVGLSVKAQFVGVETVRRLNALERAQTAQNEEIRSRLDAIAGEFSFLIAQIRTDQETQYSRLLGRVAASGDNAPIQRQLSVLSGNQKSQFEIMQGELGRLEEGDAHLATTLDANRQDLYRQLGALDTGIREVSGRMERELAASRSTMQEGIQRAAARVTEAEARLASSLSDMDAQISVVKREQERLAELLRLWEPVVIVEPAPPEAASLVVAVAAVVAVAEPADREPASPEIDLPVRRDLEAGVNLYRDGKYAAARDLLATVLERQPENDRARLYHALSLYYDNPSASSNYARIEGDLHAVSRGGHTDPEVLRVLALLAVENGRPERAVGYYKQIIAEWPGNATDLKTAGGLSFFLKDYEAASAYLDEAITLDDADPETWCLAAAAYLNANQPLSALSRSETALKTDPHYARAHLIAGEALVALGRHQDALSHFRAAPDDWRSLLAAGDCHNELGQDSLARMSWLRALDHVTENTVGDRALVAEIRLRLARLAWSSGDYEFALEHCEAGLDRSDDPMLHLYAGLARIGMGEEVRGRRILKNVAESYPETEAGRLAAKRLSEDEGGSS